MYSIASKSYASTGPNMALMSGAKNADSDSDGQNSPGARAMAQPRRGLRPQETLESDRARPSTDRAALHDLDPAALVARLQEWFGEAARGVRKADGSVDFGKVQALMSESRRQSGRAAGPLLSMAA